MNTNESSAELQTGGRCVVGVHLDIDSLRVVEVNRGRIANWASFPYPVGLQVGAKEFPAFLKSSLAGFQSTFRRASLWVVGPLPSLQVRFLSLPKARPRQMANLVYWTFRKEIPFDAAQTIFDYDVEGDPAGSGSAKKTDATAYTVAQADVDALVDLFARADLAVDGVLIPSFALRNLYRSQPASGPNPVLGLHVGEDASALLFFKGRHVVSHRVFKTGMNVMLDVLRDRHPDWSPARTYQTIGAALLSAESEGSAAGGDAGEEARAISATVHAAFIRLVQQVERSMSAYLVGRSDEEIHRLQIVGSMAGLAPLVRELGSKLGLECQPLNLFPAVPEGKTPAPGPEEGGMLALALGAALSDPAQTPNLRHTYVKRMQEARAARWRMAGALLGVAVLALLVGAGTLLGRLNRRLDAHLKANQAAIARYAPYPDRTMVQSMVNRAIADSLQMKSMAGRSLPLAALNQLAAQTPPDIRLVAVTLAREDAAGDKGAAARPKKSAAAPAVRKILLHLEGMVLGPPGGQESKLAAYMLRIEDDEMFQQVALARSEEGREGPDPVLLFGLDLKMDDSVAEPELAAERPAEKGRSP